MARFCSDKQRRAVMAKLMSYNPVSRTASYQLPRDLALNKRPPKRMVISVITEQHRPIEGYSAMYPDKKPALYRKPTSFEEVKQGTRELTPADIAEITKESPGREKTLVRMNADDFNDLSSRDLSRYQYYLVTLRKEGRTVFVNTEGFNYPRYVGLVEQRKRIRPQDRFDMNKESM